MRNGGRSGEGGRGGEGVRDGGRRRNVEGGRSGGEGSVMKLDTSDWRMM